MVLSERNGGKYLSKDWQRRREEAVTDPDRFSDNELEWLEVTRAAAGTHNPERFKVETMPIDGNTPFRERRIRTYDLRARPGAGGRDE